jgi:hypothetical protein
MIEKKQITEKEIMSGFGCCEICGYPFDGGDTVYIVDDFNAVACNSDHAKQLEM